MQKMYIVPLKKFFVYSFDSRLLATRRDAACFHTVHNVLASIHTQTSVTVYLNGHADIARKDVEIGLFEAEIGLICQSPNIIAKNEGFLMAKLHHESTDFEF